jgi:hypothetical protein
MRSPQRLHVALPPTASGGALRRLPHFGHVKRIMSSVMRAPGVAAIVAICWVVRAGKQCTTGRGVLSSNRHDTPFSA